MDGGTLIAFMVLVMRLLQPIKQLSQAPTTAQQSLASAERLFEVLDQAAETQMDRGTRKVDALREGIEAFLKARGALSRSEPRRRAS